LQVEVTVIRPQATHVIVFVRLATFSWFVKPSLVAFDQDLGNDPAWHDPTPGLIVQVRPKVHEAVKIERLVQFLVLAAHMPTTVRTNCPRFYLNGRQCAAKMVGHQYVGKRYSSRCKCSNQAST